jgi:hypothetical protein
LIIADSDERRDAAPAQDRYGSKAAIEALVKPSEVPSTADMNIGVMLAFTLTLDRHHDWEG